MNTARKWSSSARNRRLFSSMSSTVATASPSDCPPSS